MTHFWEIGYSDKSNFTKLNADLTPPVSFSKTRPNNSRADAASNRWSIVSNSQSKLRNTSIRATFLLLRKATRPYTFCEITWKVIDSFRISFGANRPIIEVLACLWTEYQWDHLCGYDFPGWSTRQFRNHRQAYGSATTLTGYADAGFWGLTRFYACAANPLQQYIVMKGIKWPDPFDC